MKKRKKKMREKKEGRDDEREKKVREMKKGEGIWGVIEEKRQREKNLFVKKWERNKIDHR